MCTETQNPKKWRYTWEAQSHLPLLKLILFSPQINPLSYCQNLTLNLNFQKSQLIINFTKNSPNLVSIFIPVPRVLIDLDNDISFKAFDDHICVKVPLLLPVDHPIVASFVKDLQFGDGFGCEGVSNGFVEPLSMESDFRDLSSKGDVDFYCRNCAFKLTKHSVRCLVDLPSINWTDVADNWFGTCCCSFGGISEKLVTKYVKSYRCKEGTCLLTTASIILCKDDIADYKPLEAISVQTKDKKWSSNNSYISKDDDSASISVEDPLLQDASSKHISERVPTEVDNEHIEKPSCASPVMDLNADHASAHCSCGHDALKSSGNDVPVDEPSALQADQKSFLNCYLGNAFIFRSDGLSKDIEWIDFKCPHCSCTLGAFPSTISSEPLDGGIRLLKCYITISPLKSSENLFSNYTLERMFTCQLLENAKDELSFRTVVKDLKTRSSMLHIVLLNPNSWCCTGCCSEDGAEPLEKIYLHPVVKILYTHCYDDPESGCRLDQEWETKNRADEIYMPGTAIKELVKYVEDAPYTFPDSFTSIPGFRLLTISR